MYAYDVGGALAAEYSSSAHPNAGETHFRLTDNIGSTRLVLDQSGNVVSRWDFYPFGVPIEDNSSNQRSEIYGYNNVETGERQGFSQKYTGQEHDSESEFDYYVGRHLYARVGRFLQPDGAFLDQRPGDPQSWNLYAYVRNNPLIFIDPSGRVCKKVEIRDEAGTVIDFTFEGDCISPGDEDVTAGDEPQRFEENAEPGSPTEFVRAVPTVNALLRRNAQLELQRRDQPLNEQTVEIANRVSTGAAGKVAESADCAAVAFLGPLVAGGALVQGSQPNLPTRGKFGGPGVATVGTSRASKISRAILPFKWPWGIKVLGTGRVGGTVGRAVPALGGATIVLGVVATAACISESQ